MTETLLGERRIDRRKKLILLGMGRRGRAACLLLLNIYIFNLGWLRRSRGRAISIDCNFNTTARRREETHTRGSRAWWNSSLLLFLFGINFRRRERELGGDLSELAAGAPISAEPSLIRRALPALAVTLIAHTSWKGGRGKNLGQNRRPAASP